MKNPKYILITGASSGIGAALALKYAGSDIFLYLSGRNKERLGEIEKQCAKKGAKVSAKVIDVKDSIHMQEWISSIKQLDLVIANAGISAGTGGGGGEEYKQIKEILDINIYGVINTVDPAINVMHKQGSGQIAIIASLAGYRGIPSSPAYCASKAAVKIYGEAMRVNLQKQNIGLTVITPGYIITPMTAVNDFYMPFLMKADKAADIIRRRLRKNPARIAFPWPLYFVVWLISALPPYLIDPIMARLPSKPSQNMQGKNDSKSRKNETGI